MFEDSWKPLLLGAVILALVPLTGLFPIPDTFYAAAMSGLCGITMLWRTWLKKFPDQARLSILIGTCVLMIFCAGIIDYFTGYDISATILYFPPIIIAGLRLGRTAQRCLVALAAVVWCTAQLLTSTRVSIPIIVWNAFVQAAIFAAIPYVIATARRYPLPLRS